MGGPLHYQNLDDLPPGLLDSLRDAEARARAGPPPVPRLKKIVFEVRLSMLRMEMGVINGG